MKLLQICLTVLLLCAFRVYAAQDFEPVITNYSDSDYNGQLQNWCVAQDKDGICYFGNNSGLLRYDGYTWEMFSLPGSTIVRSVFTDDDRIYVGTFEDFGYFQENEDGHLRYTSLATGRQGIKLENEEIWNISKLDDRIIFQSFSNVFTYNTITDKTLTLPRDIRDRPDTDGDGSMKPLMSYRVGRELFAQRTNGGFYRFENGGWRLYWHKKLYGSHIMAILPAPGGDEHEIPDGSLLFTQDHLIFKVTKGRPVPFPTEIDKELGNSRINRVICGKDSSIFVGSVGNGIFRIDKNGHKLGHYNIYNGLQNNSVLGMTCDRNGNIWATLDDGISLIHFGSPFSILRPNQNDPYIGMGYSIGAHNKQMLIATNQGCYTFSPNEGFHIFPGTKGQNWCVRTIGKQTFVGGNDQTIILDNDGNVTNMPFSGTDIKHGTIHRHEILLQSSYYPLQLYTLDQTTGKWEYRHDVKGLDAPVRQIEIDNDGTLWATHLTNGIYRCKISSDFKSISKKDFYKNITEDSIGKACFVMKIRGKVVFSQANTFYTFNETSNSFEPFHKLNNELPLLRGAKSAETVDDDHFWLATSKNYCLIEYKNDKYKVIQTIPMAIFPRMSNGDNCSITHLGNGICLFTLSEGVGKIDINSLPDSTERYNLKIHSIGALDIHGKMTRLPLTPQRNPVLEASNLSVLLSYPNYNHAPLRFHYTLTNGYEDIDTLTTHPSMSFPILRSGKHVLHCGVTDINGLEIDGFDYSFSIPKPWPLKWWAICLYIAIFAALVYVIAIFNTRISMKRRQREFDAAKAKQDLQIHEQELIIAEQQRRLLQNELSSKSKELATMALGAYAREQAVENMRASLSDLRKKGNTSSEAERVLRDISRTEGDNSVFWDIFERNFDLIHEHFFRNLRKQYPSLTASDLKFCAFLRMNLSTKEISKVTNISVRGVETARYRLRKKFALPADQSLVQFLIDFKAENQNQESQ